MKKLSIYFIIILILFILIIIYAFIEPYWIEIKETEIIDIDISPEFNNFKIVFIADIHFGDDFSSDRLEEIVNTINSLNPDLILLGGDYADSSREYISLCFDILSNLNASFGVYGVLGNHDNIKYIKDEMRYSGINILENKAYWINIGKETIKVGGISDLWGNESDISPTIYNVNKNDFVILVSHNPDFAEEINSTDVNLIDIMFSGHTHGGQVTFFGLFAPINPSKYGEKYRTGLIKKDNMNMIVTNGIGTFVLPVRFFARPQINVIYLKTSD